MIYDARTQFANATSVAAAAGTALIGDVIDTQVVRDLGQGQPVYLVMICTTSIITGGVAGTVKFQLASDAAAAIATDGSASVHYETKAFVTDDDALNDLDAGDLIAMVALPTDGSVPYERYLGILCVTATTTTTAGAISAFLTLDPKGWKAYPDATN